MLDMSYCRVICQHGALVIRQDGYAHSFDIAILLQHTIEGA